jgi:hypothetical protein
MMTSNRQTPFIPIPFCLGAGTFHIAFFSPFLLQTSFFSEEMKRRRFF